MLDSDSLKSLSSELRERIAEDRKILDELCSEVRPLRSQTRRIQPRATTAISLVGTDGGNNRVEFDPFMAQLVRVVDSSQNEHCLEVITPTTDIAVLNAKHLNPDGTGRTPLGQMMAFLGVKTLWQLAPTIQKPPIQSKSSWVQVYRELTEWAVLFKLVREKDFGTDTIIVCDGFLRSKVFAKGLFTRLHEGLAEGIKQQFHKSRRRIYLVGVAKHSKVLQRYRLAMAIEGIMRNGYPCYVEIPAELEQKAYEWSEYARGSDTESGGESWKLFVAGAMFFVKFGNRPHDPIWPIDIFLPQSDQASSILGYLLADALDGFPIPFYPQCLQRAHENAALVDFDMDVLQNQIIDAIRGSLGPNAGVLDELSLVDADPSGRRYA